MKMVVKGIFEEASTWKTIIEALSALVKEIYFSADESGLHARAIDEAHIAMVDLQVPSSVFQDYKCTSEIKFGISLTEMMQIMRRAGGSDYLEITVDETQNKFKLKLKSDKITRNFSLSLLGDISGEEIPIPKIEFNTIINIVAGVFKDAIKDAEVVGDYILLETTSDMLKVAAEGDTGNVEVIIDKGTETLYKYEVREESKAIYALKYLSDMTKAVSSTENIEIEYSSDMPLKIGFETIGGGKLEYFLAPRIEGSE
jgi:proliferating cell nuclear antigen